MTLSSSVNDLATRIAQEIKALRVATVKSYSETLSTSATSYTVTHNLGTRDVTVQFYTTADPWEQQWATVRRTTINTVTLVFTTAPAAGAMRVVIQGKAD